MVGEGKEDRVVVKFGLGKRNDRGERLIEFFKSQNLLLTNTWFKQEKKEGTHGRVQETYEDIKLPISLYDKGIGMV